MMFIGFIVANVMALLTYAVHVSMLGIRSSMSVGALFCAVGNMDFLNQAVNPSTGSILVDRMALGTFGSIIVALLTGIIVDRLHRLERTRVARMVNWWVFGVVLVGSVASLSFMLWSVSSA